MAGSTINSVSSQTQVRVSQGVSSPIERNQPVQEAGQNPKVFSFKDGFDPAKGRDPVSLNPLDTLSGTGRRAWYGARPTLPPGESFAQTSWEGVGDWSKGRRYPDSARPTLPPGEGYDFRAFSSGKGASEPDVDSFAAWSFDGGDRTSKLMRGDADAAAKPTLPPAGPSDMLRAASGAGATDGVRTLRPKSRPIEDPDMGVKPTLPPSGSRLSRSERSDSRQLGFEALNQVKFSRIWG